MTWAEDAVKRVIALHAREGGYCSTCEDSEYAVEWPCATLEAVWNLDAVIQGPRAEPIQGPRLTWREGLNYAVNRAAAQEARRTPEQQEAIRGLARRVGLL